MHCAALHCSKKKRQVEIFLHHRLHEQEQGSTPERGVISHLFQLTIPIPSSLLHVHPFPAFHSSSLHCRTRDDRALPALRLSSPLLYSHLAEFFYLNLALHMRGIMGEID
jgi:hypothetical protein